MILTTTLNLAWDVTYRVSRLDPGAAHTLELVGAQAGGKGVNVSRILKQLDVPTIAMGFVGGVTGQMVVEEMSQAGLKHKLVSVAGETRRCMAVVSEEDGQVTEINERGPEVPAEAWDEFRQTFQQLLTTEEVRVVVLSGSLPPGVPVDAYASLCRLSHAIGLPVILDTSGEALKEGLKARPDIVKPNREELLEALEGQKVAEALVAHDSSEEFNLAAWIPAAQALRDRGARAVVATFGPNGLLAVTEEGAWFARPPRVNGNPVGAGDAVTAALALGELEEAKWRDRIRDAAALSGAALGSGVAGSLDVPGSSPL